MTGSKAFAFSSYFLSYASSASSSEWYTSPANYRRLRSYLLMVSLRFGGTISLEEKPTPTCPSFVGLSRFVSNGGGFVNSGIFTTEALTSSFYDPALLTPYFLYCFLETE